MQIVSHRKIFFGCASRRDMYRMFDRHTQRPTRWNDDAPALYSGEWFEITESEYNTMFEMLPPLFMRDDMFAMREFLIGSVTSTFFALKIDGRFRWFHGYCDLAEKSSPEHMRAAIIDRESCPAMAMTRAEKLEHIWSATHDDFRDYADEGWSGGDRGKRTVLVYAGGRGTTSKLLDDLTDAEVEAKLPVQFRRSPERAAA